MTRLRASPAFAAQCLGEGRPILPVDPPPRLGAERLVERGEAGREHARVTQIELIVGEPGLAHEREREPHDLHVRVETRGAQQLGADLQRLARPAAALGVLAEHLPGVAQPERQLGAGERGRGDPGEAGREVVAEGENAAVAVGEPDQSRRDAGPTRAQEYVLVLEAGRDQLLVAGALEGRRRRCAGAGAAAGRRHP